MVVKCCAQIERPLFFIFLDHVPIPGRQPENGHGDQKAEDDHQVGQLTVLLCFIQH